MFVLRLVLFRMPWSQHHVKPCGKSHVRQFLREDGSGNCYFVAMTVYTMYVAVTGSQCRLLQGCHVHSVTAT